MKTKQIHKLFAGVLAFALGLSALALPAFAATVDEATIDTDAKASITIYKYDFTQAQKDGVWDVDSFVSTGYKESYVETTLGGATKVGDTDNVSDLGNGQTSNGYAIKGVEFTIAQVAEITTFSSAVGGTNTTMVLYGFDKTAAADLLSAIGLADGKDFYEHAGDDADLDDSKYYYTTDVLNKALSETNANDPTALRNALEKFIAGDNSQKMPLTDANGMTTLSGLSVGLYLAVETRVPEMVTNTTAPFFVSLPMTSVSGDDNENPSNPDGGHEWNYDVVVYPKNETGIPTLEKTLRESKEDTGKNNGSTDDITDGYDHNATASAGDVIDYQIITTLPSITSAATSLTDYSFVDTLTKGVTYNKNDVVLTFFTDKECKSQVAQWTEGDGKFTVAYGAIDTSSTMTITITADGLAEINGDAASAGNVNNKAGAPNTKYAGYSNYTLRITYTATVDSNADTVLGEEGNCNEVVLTWKRTSTDYYDTLNDDCHVYSFGIDLTKTFSDKNSGDAAEQFSHVKFKLRNVTDSYWVQATITDGIYYVTDHVEDEADATEFIPQTVGENHGVIVIRGLEDDTYELTEIETADGYTLLKDKITVVIETAADGKACDVYAHDVLGLLQNDPRFNAESVKVGVDPLTNIPQTQLSHNMMTAKATVDSNAVTMTADGGSVNAIVPLTVVNRPGFELPPTGERSMLLFTVVGAVLMTVSAGAIILICKKQRSK